MKKIKYVVASVLLALFAFILIGVKTIDVGTNSVGVKVGFYSLNSKLLPSSASSLWDKLSDLGLAFGFLCFIAVVGLGIYQLVKTKSLMKVNKEIYCYAIMAVLVVICYVLFEIVKVDCKPVLVDGKEKASFPSTHLLVLTSFALGATLVYSKVLKNKLIPIIGYSVSALLILITFVGRMEALDHWFTDCLAGLILGLFLFIWCSIAIDFFYKEQTKKEENN